MITSEEFLHKFANIISENVVKQLQNDLNNMGKEVIGLKTQLVVANRKIDELEQYTRKDNLRVYGIKELKGENTNELIMNVCREKMGINIQSSDISTSHRLRAPENGIKPIIVRFTRRDVKKQIFNFKKKLKGTQIVIKEDLTARKAQLLKTAAGKLGPRAVWTSNCNIDTKWGRRYLEIRRLEDIPKKEDETHA
ncbi:uncharacterized protein [Onthophagus taurus]|uniref:uncharacterized protein n=1 Tax=Onthophagus taurus TaxID=166361 RepID=UPI0039BDE80C